MRFSAIILAGGESERFGQNKLLLPLNGKTVLENTVDRFSDGSIQEVLVVVGRLAGDYQKTIGIKKIKWIFNPDCSTGMSSSVRAGIRCLSPDCDAVFFTPADIPTFRRDTVTAMMHRFVSDRIVIPEYHGHKGHPVLLDKSIAQECLTLPSEKVLYDVIHNRENSVARLAVEDEGILIDIDTMEDYERIKNTAGGQN
jgi:molybdenum cofactor cytidylyltransferase